MTLGFLDSVKSNYFDDYFYLDGISDCFGARQFDVIKTQNNKLTLQESVRQPITGSDIAKTIIKIITYTTILIPVLMLIGKLLFRYQHTFELAIPPAVAKVVASPLAGRVTVGTYNLLFPQSMPPTAFSSKIGYSRDRQTGALYENTDFRMGIIRNNILKSNLDIVCLQEVTKEMFITLDQPDLSKKYTFSWEPHTGDGHGVCLLYNKDRFASLGAQVYRASFDIPNTRKPGKFTTKTRAHLVTDLRDSTTNKVYRIASCHLLDPRDFAKEIKGRHVERVLETMAAETKYEVDCTIVAGDMNQDQFGDIGDAKPAVPHAHHATAFAPFVEAGFEVDENLESSEFEKVGFDNSPVISKDRRIDWIWAKGAKPEHLPMADFDIRGSDHRLVMCSI